MAEKDLELSEDEEKPSGKKSLLLYILIGIVAVGAGIGGTLFFLKGDSASSSETVTEAPVKKKAEYFALRPPFIVNFKDDKGRQRFLQIGVSVMSRESEAIDALKTHAPLVRNNLILLFSGQSFAELQKPEGKDKLAELTLVELQTFLQQEIDSPGVEKILFTDFVMQ